MRVLCGAASTSHSGILPKLEVSCQQGCPSCGSSIFTAVRPVRQFVCVCTFSMRCHTTASGAFSANGRRGRVVARLHRAHNEHNNDCEYDHPYNNTNNAKYAHSENLNLLEWA